MRNWIITTTLILPLLAVGTCAASQRPFEPLSESFGYSSDDWGGGAYLGVDTRNVTADRVSALKLKEEQGVEITMVDQDAPAGKAGLKEHDVILNLNGTAVESVEQLRRMIHETPPDRVISLGISRNGQPLTVKVQLTDRKKAFAYAFPNPQDFKFEMPALQPMPEIDMPVSVVVVHSSGRSGLMVENMTPQLGDFFGVKNGNGVLIRSVEKGSRAEQAGFRAGDVIVKVNGDTIADASDFSHALRSRKENTANIGIIRDRKEQTLTLKLPPRDQSSIFQESFDVPEIDAQAYVELSKSQMAKVQPQIDLAIRNAQQAIQDATNSLCDHNKKSPVVKPPAHKPSSSLRRQLDEEQQEIQKEVRHELQGLDEI